VRGVDWVPLVNASGERAPACAVARVTGYDANGNAEFDLPDADDDPGVVVLDANTIFDGKFGQGTWNPRVVVAYDPADGTPAAGEEWGVESGSWKLKAARTGFRILGGAANGLVNAVRVPQGGAAAIDWDTEDLSSDYDISASSATIVDSGLSISIPSAGDYLMFATVNGLMQVSLIGSSAAFLYARLYDDTAATPLLGSVMRFCATQVTGVDVRGTGAFSKPYTFSGAKTIKLQVARNGGGFTTTRILAGTETHIGYAKLS